MFRKILTAALVLSTSSAFAHITIGSGPAQAGKSSKITLNINHGCKDTTVVPNLTEDTVEVSVDIPVGADAASSFSGIRPMRSDFGRSVLTRNGNGAITRITWTKPVADEYAADDGFYEITFKATTPNKPFTKIPLVVTQKCRQANNELRTVVWAIGNAAEPAPNLVLIPQRVNNTGWNKITIPTAVAVADFGAYFNEALIVWKGTAAFSSNLNTKAQIESTTGVTLLATDLVAGDEVWARY